MLCDVLEINLHANDVPWVHGWVITSCKVDNFSIKTLDINLKKINEQF
jgi:hypothetical protein